MHKRNEAIMNPNQALQDTFCLLAGASVPRSSRPGESFEPATPKARRVSRRFVFQILGIVLAAVAVLALVV